MPQHAVCVIVCDNRFELAINGARVGQGKNLRVQTIDILPHLQRGSNDFLIGGINGDKEPNPAGLYVDLLFFNADEIERLPSGGEWEARVLPTADSDDEPTAWQAAVPVSPQNVPGDPSHDKLRQAIAGPILDHARPVRTALARSDMLARSLGRPNREQVVTVRPESLSTLQAIDLANGAILDSTLAHGGENLLPQAEHPNEFIRKLFLRALCREPSDKELSLSQELLGPEPTAGSIQDVLWAIIMLPEFQFVR